VRGSYESKTVTFYAAGFVLFLDSMPEEAARNVELLRDTLAAGKMPHRGGRRPRRR